MSRSLIDQKASFLRSQIRLLTASLSPSPDWQEFAEEHEEGDLPEKVIEDVLQRLNVTAKRHHQTVYSSQAVRAVAEQIDSLYRAAVTTESNNGDATIGLTGGLPEKGSDLTLPSNIALLPEDWPAPEHSSAATEDVEQYQQLRQRLMELNEQRSGVRERLAKHKQLQTLVAPLKNPKTNVQPNLVRKDGELAGQLERMRVLLARVVGRIGDMEGNGVSATGMGMGMSGEEKLRAILDGT